MSGGTRRRRAPIPLWRNTWPQPPTFTGTICFYPESIDKVLTSLQVTPDGGPEDREWGARELGLRDPNGYFLTFSEPLA